MIFQSERLYFPFFGSCIFFFNHMFNLTLNFREMGYHLKEVFFEEVQSWHHSRYSNIWIQSWETLIYTIIVYHFTGVKKLFGWIILHYTWDNNVNLGLKLVSLSNNVTLPKVLWFKFFKIFWVKVLMPILQKWYLSDSNFVNKLS